MASEMAGSQNSQSLVDYILRTSNDDPARARLLVSYHVTLKRHNIPDSKVHGANVEPIWGRQDPGGSHVGPMNLDLWHAGHIAEPASVQGAPVPITLSALLALCKGNPPVTDGSPSQTVNDVQLWFFSLSVMLKKLLTDSRVVGDFRRLDFSCCVIILARLACLSWGYETFSPIISYQHWLIAPNLNMDEG